MEVTAVQQLPIDKSQSKVASPIPKLLPITELVRPPQSSSSADIIQENRPGTAISYSTFLSAPPENNEDLDCLDDLDF